MPNHSEPPPREVMETSEYTANYDDIVERHSLAVVGPILTGLIERHSEKPEGYGSYHRENMDDEK
jgi:hypothetical protein